MGRYAKDIAGQRFDSLVAISLHGSYRGSAQWLCQCDCGNTVIRTLSYLSRDRPRTCGCKRYEKRQFYLSPETQAIVDSWPSKFYKKVYRTYAAIKNRCKDKKCKNYNGRGLTVSSEWLNSFETFVLDMGCPPTLEHSIDRIDNSKGYSKENCRWADLITQRRNQRRTKTYDLNGRKVMLADLSKELGIPLQTLYDRVIVKGWPLEESLYKYERPNQS